MEFRITTNIKTNKHTRFVDNKRVSREVYDFKETLCIVKGMSYNSSYGRHNGDLIYRGFSYSPNREVTEGKA